MAGGNVHFGWPDQGLLVKKMEEHELEPVATKKSAKKSPQRNQDDQDDRSQKIVHMEDAVKIYPMSL